MIESIILFLQIYHRVFHQLNDRTIVASERKEFMESDKDLQILKSFKTELEAEPLIGNLKSRGINAFIKKEDPSGEGLNRAVVVFISKMDYQKALDVLKSLRI